MIAPDFYTREGGKFSAVHLPRVRKPFEWKSGETVEIPLALVTDAYDENVYNLCKSFYPPHRTGVVSMMTWFSGPPPHEHIHVEFFFLHRALQQRRLSYEQAECKRSVSNDETFSTTVRSDSADR